LFIDAQVLIVDIAHSISLLTSSPDPTGEKQKHTGKRNSIQAWHRCTNKDDDMTIFNGVEINPIT
jgi:hypothetical protein